MWQTLTLHRLSCRCSNIGLQTWRRETAGISSQYQLLETTLFADIFTYTVVHYGTFRIYLVCAEPAMSNLLEVVAAHRCGIAVISEHGLWDHSCTRVLFGMSFFPSRSALHELVDSQHELLQQALANADPNLLGRWVSVLWLNGT